MGDGPEAPYEAAALKKQGFCLVQEIHHLQHLSIHRHIKADPVGLDLGAEVDVGCISVIPGKSVKTKVMHTAINLARVKRMSGLEFRTQIRFCMIFLPSLPPWFRCTHMQMIIIIHHKKLSLCHCTYRWMTILTLGKQVSSAQTKKSDALLQMITLKSPL